MGIRLGDKPDGERTEIDAVLAKTSGGALVWIDQSDFAMIQTGRASVTPTEANKVVKTEVKFPKSFPGTPRVIATPVTSAPGTSVLGCGTGETTADGFNLYATRANTTAFGVDWVAVYIP